MVTWCAPGCCCNTITKHGDGAKIGGGGRGADGGHYPALPPALQTCTPYSQLMFIVTGNPEVLFIL